MEQFVITGPKQLTGTITVAGAKNVALKVLVATALTDEPVILHNMPQILDVRLMIEVLEGIGKIVVVDGNTVTVSKKEGEVNTKISLETGARLRASSMVIGPLLSRYHKASIPNPGGCRIGARPIDRHIEGLKEMGAIINYASDDGYFHCEAAKLQSADITFEKNTHTGTETLILAAAISDGKVILRNAAEEIEIDDLIALLNQMGAKITRSGKREITIEGVSSLHGTEYTIMGDRNEEVTFAVAAVASKGNITVKNSNRIAMKEFLDLFKKIGGGVEEIDATTTRYFFINGLAPADVVTQIHPGFMTDWQAPWAILMTQATGTSTIHETVFESRFSYVEELKKMGAEIEYFAPTVDNEETFYNFNWSDHDESKMQAIRIHGPKELHNAYVTMSDLRAGATMVIAACIAEGTSVISGIDQIDRGYEKIEERLTALGADIKRIDGKETL